MVKSLLLSIIAAAAAAIVCVNAESQVWISDCGTTRMELKNQFLPQQILQKVAFPTFSLDFTTSADGYSPQLTMNNVVASLFLGQHFNSQGLTFANLNQTLTIADTTLNAPFAFINITTPVQGGTNGGPGNVTATFNYAPATLDGTAYQGVGGNFQKWLAQTMAAAPTANLPYTADGFYTVSINAPVLTPGNQAYTFCVEYFAVPAFAATSAFGGFNGFKGATITNPVITAGNAGGYLMNFTITIPVANQNTFKMGALTFDFFYPDGPAPTEVLGQATIYDVNLVPGTFPNSVNLEFNSALFFPASVVNKPNFNLWWSRYIGFNTITYAKAGIANPYPAPASQPRDVLNSAINGPAPTDGRNRGAFGQFISETKLPVTVPVKPTGFQMISQTIGCVPFYQDLTIDPDTFFKLTYGNVFIVDNPFPIPLNIWSMRGDILQAGSATSNGERGDQVPMVGQFFIDYTAPVSIAPGQSLRLPNLAFSALVGSLEAHGDETGWFQIVGAGGVADAYFYGNFTMSLGGTDAPPFVVNYMQSVKTNDVYPGVFPA